MDAAGYIVVVSLISALIVASFLALCAYVVLYRRRFCRGCASVPDDYERSVASSSVRSFHVDSHIGHLTVMALPSKEVPVHSPFGDNQSKFQQPVTFAPQKPVTGAAAAGTAISSVSAIQVPIFGPGKHEVASSQFQVDYKSNVSPEDLAVARFRKRYGPKLLSGVSHRAAEEETVVLRPGVASTGTNYQDSMTAKMQAQAVADVIKEQKALHDEQQGTEETALQFYTPPASPLNDDISRSTPPRTAS